MSVTAERLLTDAAGARAELPVVDAQSEMLSRSLYLGLAQLCKGQACAVVHGVAGNHGFEAWRRLTAEFGPTTGGRSLCMLRNIVNESATRDAYRLSLQNWENAVAVYERVTAEVLNEDLKCAVLLGGVPKDI